MRILHIINSLEIGGAEKLLMDLIQASPKYCSMDVCVLYPGGLLRTELLSLGVTLHDLNLSYKYDLWKVFRLSKLIRSGNYDIVHAHLFPSILLVALASYWAKGPHYICTEHGTWSRRRQIYGFWVLDRWIYSHYEKIIAVSPTVKNSLLSWLKQPQDWYRIAVIPSGIALPQSNVSEDIPTHDFDLIFVGRLEHEKGLDILLQALALLKEEGLRVSLLVVGTGSQANFLQKLAHTLEISGQVKFLGYSSEVRHLLRRARIFVLPSRTEGLPLAVLEAMAERKAIIATFVGGLGDILETDKDAILIPPEDPQTLAKVIKKIMDNPQKIPQMGDNAHTKACKYFSRERFVKDVIQLYEKILIEQKNCSR
jgi:glycosyltransferase involved in cell wall biosynthesis